MIINHKNINNMKQNKVSYVVKDICEQYPEVDPMFIYEVLLKRGIFKWLAAREDIIELKNEIREKLSLLEDWQHRVKNKKDWKTYQQSKGYIKAYEFILKRIRIITHSTRFRAAKKDPAARWYLYLISHSNGLKEKTGKYGEVIVK